METPHTKNILEIQSLSVSFKKRGQQIKAVTDLSLSVKKGEVAGLVGESGSGKSVTARTIAGLIHPSKNTVIEGDIRFNGSDLPEKKTDSSIRSEKINMIFQDPVYSLNPAYTAGYQIEEVFRTREQANRQRARKKSIDILRQVRVPSPEFIARQYPHQLSGGMCQRVMIAIALAGKPELLIADEPTTALDVTIQARILQLLQSLNKTTGTSILFITHDLGIIAQFCHTAAIMLEGEIVETGRVESVFANPLHPYTRGLLDSIPVMGEKKRLRPMALPPERSHPLGGCRFYDRCPRKTGPCEQVHPDLVEYAPGHAVRCFYPGNGADHG